MEGFDIIYESLDAKTRKRIDAKLAKRQENDAIQIEDTKQVMFRIGIMIMVVSLLISMGTFLFGTTELCSVFGFLGFIGLFIVILTACLK